MFVRLAGLLQHAKRKRMSTRPLNPSAWQQVLGEMFLKEYERDPTLQVGLSGAKRSFLLDSSKEETTSSR